MKVTRRFPLIRLLLNALFTGLIFWAAIANNSGSEVALGDVLLYNSLIFVPGWINNFYLLPKLRRDKKAGRYFLRIALTFLAGSLILGLYLHGLQDAYHTDDLSQFTPVGMTSSAPGFLKEYQYYFDAFPAISIVMIMLVIGYVIREFLLKLKKENHIRNEQIIAELNLLKSQISPHFLFNVLNSLYALSLNKSDKTPGVILQLSDILRYSLYETREREIPVLDEVAIIETYMAIEKMRIPATASVSFNHDEIDQTIKIAPMLLLPLIENAFKHGVDSTVDDSYIRASLSKNETRLVFTCENTYKEPKTKNTQVGGIGIQNVRKRLELLYPSRHSLEIEKQEGIFKVTLLILL
ncbi:histidine kinase [Fluviicola sp.]|uniref:sensor histidine kinase n=1 Tax=Fluviicola sp. TaxID=1917219 RepID=UPI00260F64D2|nr:histidine kinase [Fluviicola sp.]